MCLLVIKLIRKIQYTISRRKLQQQFASGTVKMLCRIRRPKAANFSIMPPAAAYLSFSLFTFLSYLHPQGVLIRLHDLDLSGGVLGLVDDDVLDPGHVRGVKAVLTGSHHHTA